ncbi:hypothetical protein SDRG_16739 [Saprolegnia diclina VS20]|uniref:RING-type domain-containing protein n=1 Tax=Saprolegnia diclina (strain VS20) TaxID=1156394 RepID=T0R7E3_SAPDV|nr:hypothetical protein SDRG_16739 [Saprolegnia diclina VS20]EQC25412.1 hypothetical protein SDRG_16739 [Saprolegnia diclina VS20]|eukprot:XP_008621179.1 hypothetical protein SDRG_16739 [Saprolegnia diclina VS20]
MANNVEGLRALFRKRRAHILFSLEYRDEQKRTPLMMACTYGFADCMRLLVEHGANLHAVDKKGNTPLHYACINGQFAIVAYLVQHTLASPFDANKSDATPLQLTRHVLESKPANWLDLAKCIELLEQRVKVFEGWLYESAPNLVADVLNIASMQSWKARYALVLRNGSRDELELHLFDVRQGLRPPIPTSIRQVPITNGVQFNKSERWWNKKPHSFLINGLYEFAALDTAGFDLWFRFFETDAATMVEDRTVITEEPSHKILVQDDENDLSSSELSPTHHLSPSAPDAMDAPPLDAIGAWGSSPPSKTSKMAKQPSSKPPAPPAPPAPPVPPLPPRTTPYSPMPPTPKKDKQVVDLTAASGDAAPAASAPDFEADDATPGKPAMLRRKSSLLDDGATSDGAKRRKGKDECVVCYDRPKATVCVPCGHVAVCVQCAETLRRTTGRCPICRGEVREVVKLFHV